MGMEDIRTIEQVSALIEEQSLTKEELLAYLRQMMEIRASLGSPENQTAAA